MSMLLGLGGFREVNDTLGDATVDRRLVAILRRRYRRLFASFRGSTIESSIARTTWMSTSHLAVLQCGGPLCAPIPGSLHTKVNSSVKLY
jgi:hypothetical protein